MMSKKTTIALSVGALAASTLITKKAFASDSTTETPVENAYFLYFDDSAGTYVRSSVPRAVVDAGTQAQIEYADAVLNANASRYRTAGTATTCSRNGRNIFTVGYSQAFLLNTNYDVGLETQRPLWAICTNRADATGSLDATPGPTGLGYLYKAILYAEWLLDQSGSVGAHPDQTLEDANAERLSLCNVAYLRALREQRRSSSPLGYGRALQRAISTSANPQWNNGQTFQNRKNLMLQYGNNPNAINGEVAVRFGHEPEDAAALRRSVRFANRRFAEFYDRYYWEAPVLTPFQDHFYHPCTMNNPGPNWITDARIKTLVGKAVLVTEFDDNPNWVQDLIDAYNQAQNENQNQ